MSGTLLSSKPASLRRNVLWTVVGNVVLATSQWAVVTVIARTLSAADVGAFSLAAALVAPILVLSQLQLRIILATDTEYRQRFKDFLVLRGVATLIMVAVVMGIVLVSNYPASTDTTILLFAVAKAFDSAADILYGYHQRIEHMRVMAVGLIVNGLLSVLLFGLGVLTTGALSIGMLGYVAGSALAFAAIAMPVTLRERRLDRHDPRGQPPRVLHLLFRALPLALVLMLASLSSNIPRYFIEGHLGSRELGLFSAASYLIIAGANVINAVGNAISPRLARLFAQGSRRQFAQVAWVTMAVGAGIGLLGALVSMVAGGPILELVYTKEYSEADGLLTALALAAVAGFAASFAVGALTAAQEFKRQIPVFVGVVIATAAASAVLIPRYGLLGAAAATAVTGAVQLVGCSVVLVRLLRRAPSRG